MPATISDTDLAALRQRIDAAMIADRLRLTEALERLVRARPDPRHASRLGDLLRRAEASALRRAEREGRLPRPEFPAELPVSGKRIEIATAIAAHPVVIVCGETGSGKTTQLPKICLEMGRGVAGLIGHTQPRRIAARTVAARIAQELGTPLGATVGYKVRFTDQTGADAYVKLMTDGILLAETQGDRLLGAYDTLIVDEAHERSLNIDFLLGYLHRLLPRRPDLKVVITSATIDAERFSRHFGGAPVIEVSGRLYPVDVRYRPPAGEEEDRDPAAAVIDAVGECARTGPGDVLVFLPGEREIREAAEALRKHHPPGTEILPLFARLSAAEQERVFQPGGARRVVLATNVAETSLTVPGIRYVVDTGQARINRYSYRNKVEQLLTEKISRASADQRAGRCGRVSSGVCLRLYAEEDYAARPAFTDPEILRSSLASVILRMTALDLGAIDRFPFVDPPQPRMIADGYQLLAELGAVDEARRLTPVGRALARLPIDPRIGRMVLAAREENCLAEVLVLAAALSVQDPRDRPLERAQSADDRHAAFRDERSDFAGLLKLWKFHDELVRHRKSARRLAQTLREHFLSPARMREWREVHGQLHALITEMGMRPNTSEATYEQVHRALLAGLLGSVGTKSEQGDYDGARGIRFAVHPGSGLRKRQPRWVVCAELVETSRLYARVVAQVEPEWIERAAAHLVKKTWFEPRWERESARVVAWEQVNLYGLVLVGRRKVHYGSIDPAASREIFIRAGLVEGGYASDAPFLRHNRDLRREVEALEHKSRRRDVLVDEEAMFRFYDRRIPPEAVEAVAFEAWRRDAERAQPRRLFMAREDLMRHAGEGANAALFPDTLEVGGVRLALRYRFDPGHPLDGVTVTIPLHLLNAVPAAAFEWMVPGLLRDKINALVRGLPKTLRRNCVPLPETVTACLVKMEGAGPDADLHAALASALKTVRGIDVPADTWSGIELAPHLRMHFRIVDDKGKELASGRDLAALRDSLGEAAEERFAAPDSRWEQAGLKAWPPELELASAVSFRRGAQQLTGYPALVDEGDSVRLTLVETPARARALTPAGIDRLVRLELREPVKALARALTPGRQLALAYAAWGGGEQLAEELVRAVVHRAVWADDPTVDSRKAFDERLRQVRARLQVVGQEYLRLVDQILAEAQAVRARLADARAFRHAQDDIQRQLEHLLPKHFIAATPYPRLQQVPRYLKGMQRRIAKLSEWAERDRQHTQQLARWWSQYEQRLRHAREEGGESAALEDFRWMLEEQRISLFAQELKTPYPVSYKRLEKAWAGLGQARSP